MKGARIVVMVLAMPLALAMSHPPSPVPTESTAHQQQAAKNKEAESYVCYPRLTFTDAHLNKLEIGKKTQETQNRSATKWWGIGIAFLTFIAICVQVWVYLKQAGIMERALQETQRGNTISREGLTKLQRAFVIFKGPPIYLSHKRSDDHDAAVYWTFHFNWENAGASLATELVAFVDFYLGGEDISKDHDLSAPAGLPKRVLGPRSSLGIGEFPIDGADLVAVREGKKFLYFWGSVTYRDIFDDTPLHFTEFFFQVVNVRGDPTKPWDAKGNIVEIITNNQPRHNDAS